MTRIRKIIERPLRIDIETKALVSSLDLVTKNNPELLQRIFENRVTDMCLSLYNADGTLRKCQKSKIVNEINLVL